MYFKKKGVILTMYHQNYHQKEKELEVYSKATALFDFSNSIVPSLKCPKCGSGEFTSVKVEDLSTYIDDLHHRYRITCVCGEIYQKDKSHNWMFGESKDKNTWEDYVFLLALVVASPIFVCGVIYILSSDIVDKTKSFVLKKKNDLFSSTKKVVK